MSDTFLENQILPFIKKTSYRFQSCLCMLRLNQLPHGSLSWACLSACKQLSATATVYVLLTYCPEVHPASGHYPARDM